MGDIITFERLGRAICDTFIADSKLLREVQNLNELTESITVTPTMQVYPQDGSASSSSENDRYTMKAGVRLHDLTYYLDVFAAPRARLAQDVGISFKVLDDIYLVLESQRENPLFGLTAIKSFSWSWERTTMTYNDKEYAGMRIMLKLHVY